MEMIYDKTHESFFFFYSKSKVDELTLYPMDGSIFLNSTIIII